jgi:hypothetical protein
MFSSGIGHSGAHWSKLRTTFGFSRIYNCNKRRAKFIALVQPHIAYHRGTDVSLKITQFA